MKNYKTISILGDSISTFEDFIPKENKTYYPQGDVLDISE